MTAAIRPLSDLMSIPTVRPDRMGVTLISAAAYYRL
jgi:hypothetical protein